MKHNQFSAQTSLAWIKRKAHKGLPFIKTGKASLYKRQLTSSARNGLNRIWNTVKEYRSWQRRDLPRASAVRPALPVGRLARRAEFGDTIIEVMVAATLVIAILGIGYALSRQGLRQTTDDSLRSQAVAYGQSQVEYVRNAINNYSLASNTLLDTYQSGALSAGFCILSSGAAQNANPASDTNKLCSQYTGRSSGISSSPYSIKNTYNAASKVFSILIQWAPISTTRDTASLQQLSFYYKAP